MKQHLLWALSTGFCFLLVLQSEGPRVEVPILPKSLAMSPTPPANATRKGQKNSIGKGSATVTAPSPSPYWEHAQAMGGVIQATVETAFLHDETNGILYAYRDGDFNCGDKHMSGHVLEALYTAQNKAGKPAGSGWYAAELNKGECGAPVAGLYGCRFSAEGQHTECGHVAIDGRTGEANVEPAR
jgi:hypothetical protein